MTGSGRGIGRDTAIVLSKRGFNVVLCSRTQVFKFGMIALTESVAWEASKLQYMSNGYLSG